MKVWGKVICLQVCVCPQGGVPAPGWGVWSRGVCSQGVGACLGGLPRGGGCLVETPPTATAAGGTHPTGNSFLFHNACDFTCIIGIFLFLNAVVDRAGDKATGLPYSDESKIPCLFSVSKYNFYSTTTFHRQVYYYQYPH